MPSQRNRAVSMVLGLKKPIWTPWKLLVANVQVWVSRRLFTVRMTLGEINHCKNSARYYCNVSDFLPFRSFPWPQKSKIHVQVNHFKKNEPTMPQPQTNKDRYINFAHAHFILMTCPISRKCKYNMYATQDLKKRIKKQRVVY